MFFDRPAFAEKLSLAKGTRSINRYGMEAEVDPGYISRLLREAVSSAPGAAVIRRLADCAYNGVTMEDLLAAAGYLPEAEAAAVDCTYPESEDRTPRDLEQFFAENEIVYRGLALSAEDKQDVLASLELLFKRARKTP